MIEPDPGAPLDIHRATVLPEWIDCNGHMNVGFYVVAFDKATDTLCNQFGVGWELKYFRSFKGRQQFNGVSFTDEQLSFFRATMSVVIRY